MLQSLWHSWTALHQRFRVSLYFLSQSLAIHPMAYSLKLSALLQYVDDLLLCFQSHAMAIQYTAILFKFFSSWGYAVSATKAHITFQKVRYLDVSLRTATHSVTASLKPPQVPITKQ